MALKHQCMNQKFVILLLCLIVSSAINYCIYIIKQTVLYNPALDKLTKYDLNTQNGSSYHLPTTTHSECNWYYNQNWQSLLNSSWNRLKVKSIEQMYKLGTIYNYSISLNHIDKRQKVSTIPRQRMHPGAPFPVECSYIGKVFNIGIQKTGTSSLGSALILLNYDCNSTSGISPTCNYHLPWMFRYPEQNNFKLKGSKRKFKNKMLWKLSTDDISLLFMDFNYTKALYFAAYSSEIFADAPWCYFYPVLDVWFPKSKFIYTVRKSTYARINSGAKYQLLKKFRYQRVHGINNTLEINTENKILWNSILEHQFLVHDSMEEFIMLSARVYEKQHENVFQYFGKNRIGNGLNDDMLILCLECDHNPWQKLFDFLGCELKGNLTTKDIKFPRLLNSDKYGYLPKYYVPRNFSLNWREYNKYSTFVTEALDMIHDGNVNLTQRFRDVAQFVYGYYGPLQSIG